MDVKDGRIIVDIVGKIPVDGVQADEYYDYIGRRFRLADIDQDLKNGNMPPGLVLRDAYGTIAIVAKDRHSLMRLEIK